MKTAACLFLALAIIAGGIVSAQATDGPAAASTASPPFSMQDARDIISDSRKITTPQGIETVVSVEINGTKQWLSIRGKDRRNPILLFLHGGPGSVDMPLAYTFQGPWEDYFTVVQWDQRGAGKTYASNDPKQVAATMTVEQMTSDTEAVIQYLRTTYKKPKVFLLGHSFGSALGVQVAQQHPEWLYAYIGVGQVADMQRSEKLGYEFAVREAKAHGNAQALKELAAIAPYPGTSGEVSIATIGVQRKWLSYYGGLAYGRTSFQFDANAWQLAPEYSDSDLDAIGKGSLLSLDHLLGPLMRMDYRNVTHFACPVFFFLGRHDYAVSQEVAAQWFATIDAPSKRLIWFADSAHMVMQEQPGRFLKHLVDDVRPIAVKAGDAAPDELTVDH
jgi:pimeloyl-ACP methyl ester carboxylesterase